MARSAEVAATRDRSASSRIDHRLKVVYLDHVAQLSGGEIALLRLLPALDRVNAHVILAEDGPLVGRLHLAGISTEVLRLAETARDLRKGDVRRGGVSPRTAAATAAYVVRLAARLRALAPDVVHTNSLKAGIYGSLAARLAGIPLIWHVRDRISEDYLPGPCSEVDQTDGQTVRDCRGSKLSLDAGHAGRTAQPGGAVFGAARGPQRRPPRATARAEVPLTFGVVGRLAPWKGQDFFLRSFAHAFPDGPERAVVVGGALFGEDAYARQLPVLARSLGIADRVDLRGQRTDVWDELSTLDVLVHSSITPEPFGQVILEGMAAGVPVIAADAGGPAEILEHDVTGILYAPKEVAGLAAAMQRMRDKDLRARLSAAAHLGLSPYAPAAVAAQLQDLYEAVVAVGRREV